MQQVTSSICFPADPATNTGAVFLYCLAASLTVIPWRKARRESQAIKDFNNYWHARLLLLLVGGLWVVSILIASPCEHLEDVVTTSRMTCSLLLTLSNREATLGIPCTCLETAMTTLACECRMLTAAIIFLSTSPVFTTPTSFVLASCLHKQPVSSVHTTPLVCCAVDSDPALGLSLDT